MAAQSAAAPGVRRKKFATPPVKNACLACRASRTRCDGGQPCANCRIRNRQCLYKPSRRGGARVRNKAKAGDTAQQQPSISPTSADEEVHQHPISLQDYVDPGAGLKQLQDIFPDSDFIFDDLFMPGVSSTIANGDGFPHASLGFDNLPISTVRTYKSDHAILDAYYVFIHPYFPILPPPTSIPTDQAVPKLQTDTDRFEHSFALSRPISLAISAILALIPCANDPNPAARESLLFRRKYAQYLAQCTIEAIEDENEILESSVAPHEALNRLPSEKVRDPFHSAVPAELESIVALDILSIYEYAQRGNIRKMQARAGQALLSAMELSLHCSTEEDEYTEARSRVWWMTYICASQSAIVASVEPSFVALAPSFTAKYPTLASDPEGFGILIQAQQAILKATQFVRCLKKTLADQGDMNHIYERMHELELSLEPLTNRADSWILPSSIGSPVDPTEEVVSRAIRCIARIKLNSARIKCHRYCAFSDAPVFSGKHCDLEGKSDGAGGAPELQHWPSCACSALSAQAMCTSSDANSASPHSHLSPHSDVLPGTGIGFPFTSHQSAQICLRAALNIAQSFDDIPYPNPSGQLTMPSFACCAMQSAYALLMVHEKTKTMYPQSGMGGPMVQSLLARLQSGLTSVSAALENYAMAFEALGGMRDQIRGAISPTMVFAT
ncbi:C6 zinc finger domain-containing protein [Sodiomyces alkalinus F11]|uniref:C6 zinc finger domain-containing protein n=1 Tax=Sodiomyces alkalinus (strain CBS 110278 / VKM F-3762 / F11) TaxID=1314773 RepID=A0A3N2Q770_SODAK|nr:C6 zinc finger domain-containing protein [Sodiomyces alkalinus F11]ROT42537.1 C6 zinc finger domain-containing protein [Sodiomyces alkalinus F11]